MAMAIEKPSFIPCRIKVNPDIMAATIKTVPIIDSNEKLEPVNLMIYRRRIIETNRIRIPFDIWAKTSNPPE